MIPETSYRRKLFWNAWAIRVIYIVFSYLFYQYMTGIPFEFGAGDSLNYHESGKQLVSLGLIKGPENILANGFSDSGFVIFLIYIYSIFGPSVLISRMIIALLSSWSCIVIYRLARRHFGEATGRIAGILMMLLPNLIYYCGLHLKETLMVFLCIAFIERADYVIRFNSFRFWPVIMVALLALSLFFFRTVLGAVAIFALLSAFLLSPQQISSLKMRFLVAIWLLLLGGLFYSGTISKEVTSTWEEKESQQEKSMAFRANRSGGNSLATYGSAAIFTPAMLFVPFPTLTHTGQDSNQNLLLMNGSFYTRNVYVFFVILALIAMVRLKSIRKHILILSFTGGYLLVLANSGFALSERFHLPTLPFLIVLASFGITRLNNRNMKFYIPYLVLIVFIIIGWNWFKLAGRGLG